MRSSLLVVVLGVLAVGCQCGGGPVTDAGTGGGGGEAMGGGTGGAGGGGSVGGGTGGGGEVDAGDVDAGADDAGVDAGTDAGCSISVNPAALAFGPTAPGCASRAVLSVSNTCGVEAPVAIVVTTGPFSVELDGGSFTLDAGATAQVPFLFQPTDAGAETGVANLASVVNVIDVPLTGTGVLMPVVTETFRQANRVRANLLVVMSDGPGMVPAQQALSNNFSAMVQYAAANQFDFRIGVIAGRLDGGTLVGGVMSQNRPNLAQQFTNSVSLGESHTPTESCLERAVQELSDGGADWLYARASFSLLCVQNTPETLDGSVPVALQTLSTLVGNPTHLEVHALANFEPGCPAPDDLTLRSAVDATGGSAVSICPSPDGGIAPSGGRLLGDYENTFVLSRRPDAMTLQVALDGVNVPPVDPNTMTPLWSYDGTRNAIVFERIAVPQPGAMVTVRYSPACTP